MGKAGDDGATPEGEHPTAVGWRSLSADLLLKIVAFVPLRSIPSMSAACRALRAACEDDTVWQSLCEAHAPALEFRAPAERQSLGSFRALFKQRHTFLGRLSRAGEGAGGGESPARASACVSIPAGGVRCLDTSGGLLAAGLSSGAVVIFDREKLAQGSAGACVPVRACVSHGRGTTAREAAVCCALRSPRRRTPSPGIASTLR
jgi:hypothetical protein